MMSGRESETECEFEDMDSDSETRKAQFEAKMRWILQKFLAEYAVKFPVVRKSIVSKPMPYSIELNQELLRRAKSANYTHLHQGASSSVSH